MSIDIVIKEKLVDLLKILDSDPKRFRDVEEQLRCEVYSYIEQYQPCLLKIVDCIINDGDIGKALSLLRDQSEIAQENIKLLLNVAIQIANFEGANAKDFEYMKQKIDGMRLL
jgi:hypothetical protein